MSSARIPGDDPGTLPTALHDVVGAVTDFRFNAPEYMKNVIQLITETGFRVYKELALMRKDQVDLANAAVWIPDSNSPNGVAEVPLSDLAQGRCSVFPDL